MNSTAEHVNESYNSRSNDARDMLAAYETGDSWEGYDAGDSLSDLPLSIERKVLVTITLGTGGPSDWIDAVCSTFEGELGIESATYTAVWGSDRKVTELRSSDALWKLAEYYIEGMEA